MIDGPYKTLAAGDYARIMSVPDSWEGSGEDTDDRVALVGHVGLVIEVDDDLADATSCRCALLRFPWLDSEGVTAQRNVELSRLYPVSSPQAPLPLGLIENSGPGTGEIIKIRDRHYTFTRVDEGASRDLMTLLRSFESAHSSRIPGPAEVSLKITGLRQESEERRRVINQNAHAAVIESERANRLAEENSDLRLKLADSSADRLRLEAQAREVSESLGAAGVLAMPIPEGVRRVIEARATAQTAAAEWREKLASLQAVTARRTWKTCDKCKRSVPCEFIAIELKDGAPIDDPAGFMWCVVCHDRRSLEELRQRATTAEEAQANVWAALADYVSRNGDFPEGTSVAAAVQLLASEVNEVRVDLAQRLAARDRAFKEFGHTAERLDGECQCPYCRMDPELLAEMAADYELRLYAETERVKTLRAVAASAEEQVSVLAGTVAEANRGLLAIRDANARLSSQRSDAVLELGKEQTLRAFADAEVSRLSSQLEQQRADIGILVREKDRLSSQLHEAQQEIAALEERWETHDSAVCPEDVGCVEYISILERRIAVFKQERSHQEVERLTGQVSHLSLQLAGMRVAVLGLRSRSDDPRDEPCWCGVSVGFGTEHADYCLAVFAALSETSVPAPPPEVVHIALQQAVWSPCRSKRGAAVFHSAGRLERAVIIHGRGHNQKPDGFECDGSETCKATCRTEAIHAEQKALLNAGASALGADLLHVKVVDGSLVPSGPPSCVECSKLALASGIEGVWLYHETGWRRYEAKDFHALSLASRADAKVATREDVKNVYAEGLTLGQALCSPDPQVAEAFRAGYYAEPDRGDVAAAFEAWRRDKIGGR